MNDNKEENNHRFALIAIRGELLEREIEREIDSERDSFRPKKTARKKCDLR